MVRIDAFLLGVDLYILPPVPIATEQWRRPRSRKRRIRQKWARVPSNWRYLPPPGRRPIMLFRCPFTGRQSLYVERVDYELLLVMVGEP